MAHSNFRNVKDFSDPGFNRQDPREVAEATLQRAREAKIAVEEMKVLQEELFKCYLKNAPDHFVKCKDLAVEYRRRIDWPHHLPPAGYEGSSVRWRRNEEGSYVFERK